MRHGVAEIDRAAVRETAFLEDSGKKRRIDLRARNVGLGLGEHRLWKWRGVVAEAEMKGERFIHHAHSRLLSILEEITDLKRQRIQLTESLRQVLNTHHTLLDVTGGTSERDDPVTYLGAKKIVHGAPTLPPPSHPPH